MLICHIFHNYLVIFVCTYAHVLGGQTTIWESGLSPSTMWGLRTELRSSGLAKRIYTCWAVLMNPCSIVQTQTQVHFY